MPESMCRLTMALRDGRGARKAVVAEANPSSAAVMPTKTSPRHLIGRANCAPRTGGAWSTYAWERSSAAAASDTNVAPLIYVCTVATIEDVRQPVSTARADWSAWAAGTRSPGSALQQVGRARQRSLLVLVGAVAGCTSWLP